MGMVSFDEAGQAFVDWDSLELITNEEFVECIQFMITDSFSKKRVKYISNSHDIVEVFLFDEDGLHYIYKFYTHAKKFIYYSFSHFDIERYVKVLGGSIEWQK